MRPLPDKAKLVAKLLGETSASDPPDETILRIVSSLGDAVFTEIITSHYGIGRSAHGQEDIGKSLPRNDGSNETGVTKQRVHQIEREGLRRLRRSPTLALLLPYLSLVDAKWAELEADLRSRIGFRGPLPTSVGPVEVYRIQEDIRREHCDGKAPRSLSIDEVYTMLQGAVKRREAWEHTRTRLRDIGARRDTKRVRKVI